MDTGECIVTLEGHTGYVMSVAFNHDGTKIVSGSYDETSRLWNEDVDNDNRIITIRVWNVDTGECMVTLKGHTDIIRSVALNHDGTKIVSGSRDKTIRVWNVDTGECILTLEGHICGVRSVAFNHDGTNIISVSNNNTIDVWEMVKFV